MTGRIISQKFNVNTRKPMKRWEIRNEDKRLLGTANSYAGAVKKVKKGL